MQKIKERKINYEGAVLSGRGTGPETGRELKAVVPIDQGNSRERAGGGAGALAANSPF